MFTEEDLNVIDNLPIFGELYGDKAYAKSRFGKLYGFFKEMFGKPESFYLFSTPGRTEISGNHTDHNNGCVMAGSVNLDSIAVVAPTNDSMVNIYSVGYKRPFNVDISQTEPVESEKETTRALVRGIAAKFKELGYKVGGFNAYIASDVKRGSGLSSSASIEVLVGKIFSRLYNADNEISPVELAKIGQYAENVYFGKPCGLMDQTACAVGGVISIDFKDTKNPVVEQVQLDLEKLGYCLAVVDTGGNHADLTDDYASVPREMKSVAKELGKSVMREVTKRELMANVGSLRAKLGDRAVLRAIHFVNENERVVKQIECIKNGKFDEFLAYVNESGNSSWEYLQNCMTTKNPAEQGVTLALAMTREFCDGMKYATRVHGGGFAGTVQTFLPLAKFDEYKNAMETVFGKGCVTKLNIRNIGTLCIE